MSPTELSADKLYDVVLQNKENGAQVFWTIEVNRRTAHDAVQELLVMKEKDTEGAFDGEIIIRPTSPIVIPQYLGIKCEDDSDDNSGSGHRHLQSVGGNISSADGTSYSHNRVQKAVQEYKTYTGQDWRSQFEKDEAIHTENLDAAWSGLERRNEIKAWTAQQAEINQVLDREPDSIAQRILNRFYSWKK